MRFRSPPALRPAASKAPSVGSPMTFHVPSSWTRCALLQPRRTVASSSSGAACCASAFLALDAHFAVRPVAFAGDFIALARDVERAHGHLADRQGAGLVRADDRRRTERLDGRQFAHQRAAAGHAQHAEREGHRDDGRQPFRHGGDGEADGGHEQLQGGPAQQPQPEQQGDDAQRRPDEDAPERVELFSSGVRSSAPAASISPAMRPNSVFIAVATTTATPVPPPRSCP
jgi:hypothetical protein